MKKFGWAWWYMPAVPALRRVRQVDSEFEASLGCIARPVLKRNETVYYVNNNLIFFLQLSYSQVYFLYQVDKLEKLISSNIHGNVPLTMLSLRDTKF
jgi:hypothetical protein